MARSSLTSIQNSTFNIQNWAAPAAPPCLRASVRTRIFPPLPGPCAARSASLLPPDLWPPTSGMLLPQRRRGAEGKTMKRREPPTLRALVPWWFNPVFDLPPRHEDTKECGELMLSSRHFFEARICQADYATSACISPAIQEMRPWSGGWRRRPWSLVDHTKARTRSIMSCANAPREAPPLPLPLAASPPLRVSVSP